MPAACVITGIPYGHDLNVTVGAIRDLLASGVIHTTTEPGVYVLNKDMDSQLWSILRNR